MRKSIRVLIDRLVDIRNKFDNQKEHVQLLVADLMRARGQLGRMKDEIDDLMAGIDAIEKVK